MSLVAWAAVGAPLVALVAWRVGALSVSGAVAAAAIGFCCLAFGGIVGAAALLTFFGTSTLLSRVGRAAKERLDYEKGGRRDAGQALANGGVAALCLALGAPTAALGALAAANADTWATEVGSLLGGQPRRITDLRPAAVGESGAISLAGTLAALAGAALIGIVSGRWLAVTVGGLCGALFDSLLGATMQAQYECAVCGRRTERRSHCEAPARRVRGLAWMGNDAVNAIATVIGALVAWGLGER